MGVLPGNNIETMEEKEMSDTYREILVKRETPALKRLLKGAIPVMMILCLVCGIVMWPLLILAVVFALLTFFVAPKMDVEYEYLYVNGELDIDAIYSRQKRKRVGSYDMAELELLAPEKSHALDSYLNNKSVKVKDFTSGTQDAKGYVLIFNHDKGQEIIKVEIDEMIIKDIRRIAPRKVNLM